jgi:hypothetical protein
MSFICDLMHTKLIPRVYTLFDGEEKLQTVSITMRVIAKVKSVLLPLQEACFYLGCMGKLWWWMGWGEVCGQSRGGGFCYIETSILVIDDSISRLYTLESFFLCLKTNN